MKSTIDKKNIVSVIIPAYNEEQTIQQCLDSLADQIFKDIEVVVVDDFSSDKTSAIAKKWAEQLSIKIKVVRNRRHRERGVTRNLGAKVSTGNYFLFIDTDMKVGKRVISDCIKLIRNNPKFKAIIIPEKSFGKGFWAKCKSLEKLCYIGDDRMEAARFFERKAFWRVGGWDNKMISGEDWDLTRRIRKKYKIGRINAEIFHNEGKLTIWKIIKKKFYYASKSHTYFNKYPLTIVDVFLFVFRPAYFRNWKLILSYPLYGLGIFLLKTIEMFTGALGYLYSKILNLH